MPEKRFFLKLSGVVLLGLITLLIAAMVFLALLPFILIVFIGTFLLFAAFLIIWAVVYAAAVIGVAIYYFFKPMQVSEKDKGYSIKKVKESGKREKGKS